eukprot:TRINITY_DN1503_c1_g1_i1.p1 TRINITY_DN1503_c1_g1~~TRINITY_DN1503_c1_g1_i1.p1  ORF type:complete len:348 (-),score=134.32 TRINITY_DN1503_c1_g1_i1:869-1870(-)
MEGDDEAVDKGEDWEHDEEFTDDDEAVEVADKVERDEEPAEAPPPAIKEDEELEEEEVEDEEEGGLSTSGKELRKLLHKDQEEQEGEEDDLEDMDDDEEDEPNLDIGFSVIFNMGEKGEARASEDVKAGTTAGPSANGAHPHPPGGSNTAPKRKAFGEGGPSEESGRVAAGGGPVVKKQKGAAAPAALPGSRPLPGSAHPPSRRPITPPPSSDNATHSSGAPSNPSGQSGRPGAAGSGGAGPGVGRAAEGRAPSNRNDGGGRDGGANARPLNLSFADEVRSILVAETRIGTKELVARFKGKLKTAEDKGAFQQAIRQVTKLDKSGDVPCLVLK